MNVNGRLILNDQVLRLTDTMESHDVLAVQAYLNTIFGAIRGLLIWTSACC